jgi:hypothetical protein
VRLALCRSCCTGEARIWVGSIYVLLVGLGQNSVFGFFLAYIIIHSSYIQGPRRQTRTGTSRTFYSPTGMEICLLSYPRDTPITSPNGGNPHRDDRGPVAIPTPYHPIQYSRTLTLEVETRNTILRGHATGPTPWGEAKTMSWVNSSM